MCHLTYTLFSPTIYTQPVPVILFENKAELNQQCPDTKAFAEVLLQAMKKYKTQNILICLCDAKNFFYYNIILQGDTIEFLWKKYIFYSRVPTGQEIRMHVEFICRSVPVIHTK